MAEDEVVQILSLSSLSDLLAYILDSASHVNFANADADYTYNERNGTTVGWKMFIVLLSLAHQLSDLDLDTFVRQFRRLPSQAASIGESANPATGRQHAYPYSSQPQSPAFSVDYDTPIQSHVKETTPLGPLKQAKFASYELMDSQQDSRDSIADGFHEYSNNFVTIPQTVPLSSILVQAEERRKSLPVYLADSDKIQNPVLGHISPMASRVQAGFHDQKYPVDSGLPLSHNIVDLTNSFYDGLIPADCSPSGIGESSQQILEYSGLELAHPSAGLESASSPFGPSQQSLRYPGIHIDPPPPDPRTAPILLESLESLQHSELEIVHPVVDPKSDPIPVLSLQQGTSEIVLDDDWQPARASSFWGYDTPQPSSGIFEAEVPDVTAESRRIARNRLIALQDKEPAPKPFEVRSLSIFGRKKASDAPASRAAYSWSILATGLENAAKEGSLPLVATFIEFGADPNYRSKSPRVRHDALQYAATGGYTGIVEYLVRKGADTIAVNNALIYAILRGHVDLAMRLISAHRADVNTFKYLPVKQGGALNFSKGRVYANALAIAAFINNKHDRIRLVQFLLAQKCDIDNIIWFLFKTAENVEYGFGYSNLALFVPKCPFTVDILLKSGITAHTVRKEAPIEVLKGFRKAGFHCESLSIVQAISRIQSTTWEFRSSECLDIAAQLVHNGSDPNRLEFDGIEDHTSEWGWKMTPLARAIKSGVIHGVEGLLQLGAKSDSVVTLDGPGYTKSRTLLHYAVQRGDKAIIRTLISNGADVNALSNIYNPQNCQAAETAMAEAASLGHLEIVKVLLGARAHPNDGSLHKAARNAQLEIAKLLLQYGAKLGKEVDSVSWPTLSRDDYTWKYNPDFNRVRKPRGNVLCFAMSWPGCRRKTSQEEKDNYLNLVNLLLNAYDAHGLPVEQTVLRAALDANNTIGLKQLLNFPFRLKQPEINVFSPMFYIWSQPVSMSRTGYGFTPVQYALMMHCDDSLVDFLVSKGASKIRVIYSSDSKDQRVVDGTRLIWEICSVNRPIPKRVDGLEGAKEYTTEPPNFRYGGYRPVHITKIKI
jgi:ankyrin repeat protein